MCRYAKRIVYFDLMVEGEKVGNAGFAKLIVQNGQMRIMVNVSGLHKSSTTSGELVMLQSGKEIFLDSLCLKEGRCVYSRLLNSNEIAGLGINWDLAYGICVKLEEGRCLKALWGDESIQMQVAENRVEILVEEEAKADEITVEECEEPKAVIEEREEQKTVIEEREEDKPVMEGREERKAVIEECEEPKAVLDSRKEPKAVLDSRKEPKAVLEGREEQKAVIEEREEDKPVLEECQEQGPKAGDCSVGNFVDKISGIPNGISKKIEMERILDDKWKQLEKVFPHIHPFGDSREYLSVAPKDYIVLTREYQKLANNSFLLHGFYNYRHTILGKIPSGREGQDKFYLGVPGVFYEREKSVALMFGFESFECANEPAQTGTFGYYMRRVDI